MNSIHMDTRTKTVLTVAMNPFTVVKPLCNILKKFLGFRALIKTAFQNGAMNVLQSACTDRQQK